MAGFVAKAAVSLFFGLPQLWATGDENWDTRFGPAVGSSLSGSPMDSMVNAVALDDAILYLGGQFTSIDGVALSNLARWDGLTWQEMSGGVDGPVRSLLVSGTNVFVGGAFSHAGGIEARNVARWDGSSWHALGGGVSFSGADSSDGIIAMVMSGEDLYVGGRFDKADGNAATNIARWDGASWHPLLTVYPADLISAQPSRTNNGLSGPVKALASSGGTVYVGGSFRQSTGAKRLTPLTAIATYATNLAAWNGSSWSDVGWRARTYYGSVGSVECLAWNGNRLIAGGTFSGGNGDPFDGVALWDGTRWSALGSGIQGSVRSLSWVGTNLYAGGFFATADGVSANSLAVWNGSSWSAAAQTINTVAGPTLVNAIGGDRNGNLYAGGLFTQIDSAQVQNIAVRSAGGWGGLGQGLTENQRSGAGYALVRYQGSIVVAGAFTSAGGVQARNIAAWNGTGWSYFGQGLNGSVSALAVMNSNLYAAGNFSIPGFPGSRNIAAWDGAQWLPLGLGLEGPVHALAVMNDRLFVGGEFKTASGLAADGIAVWNGSSWQNVGPPHALSFAKIYALATMGGKLYAGGLFGHNAAGNSIAAWDGFTWSNLGLGLQSRVYASAYALATDGNRLFVGGNFETAGAITTPNLAVWDGSDWNSLGIAPQGVVFALQYSAGTLYAGGVFVNGFDAGANNIASWNGIQWSALGRGIGFPNSGGSFVEALLADESSLYAVGNFSMAGGHASDGIALYHLRSNAKKGASGPLIRAINASGSVVIQLDSDAAGYSLETCTDPRPAQPVWTGVSRVSGATNILIKSTSPMQLFRLVN